jgi:hypothetical protein
MNQRIDNAMIKILTQVMLIVLIVLFLTQIVSMNVIHYSALAENVTNGVTYILYSGLFSPIIWVVLVLVGLLYLVSRDNVAFRFMVILLVFLWPMVIMLNFLIHGYVVGDQPRTEFALSSFMVSGRVTFSQASSISGYFDWPSTWLLEGIFSNVVDVSPFAAPVYLMVITYLLLGLALVVMGSRLLPHHEYDLAMVSMLAYAILNPYKILHFSPQVYALTLFALFLTILLKRSLTMEDFIPVFIFSMAIITSHPLTSIVVAGIIGSILIFNLVKRGRELRGGFILSAIILILFITWNLRYENLLSSVVMELKKPQIQPLPPVSGLSIYSVNVFFKLMAFYRYISFTILIVGSLLAVAVLLKRKSPLRVRVFAIGVGIIAGSALLNFIPGAFFSRLLYFTGAFISGLFPIAIHSVKERLRKGVFLEIILLIVIILIPILSHVALLEFLTDNNPVATITGPYETSADIFIAEHYNFGGCIGIPSGALSFYVYMTNPNLSKPLCTYLLSNIASSVLIRPLNYLSASIFVKSVYIGNIFEVSPKEIFNYYMRTLINNFKLVDYYLNVNYDLIYNNGVFKIYSTFGQR